MNKYQLGYITSEDPGLASKIIKQIGKNITQRASVKAYVAKEVFDNINKFIENLKEKNENKEDLTDREYHLANSGFNVIVNHFVKNNIGAKVFLNGTAVNTKLTVEENEEIVSALLVKKRNGQFGMRVKTPEVKLFMKNFTVNDKEIHDIHNNKLYVVKNNLIFKSENGNMDSDLFSAFKDTIIYVGKRSNIDGIIYEKTDDSVKEYLAYGKIHDGLLKAKMISESSKFLTQIDNTFQEIIKRTEPLLKKDSSLKSKPLKPLKP